MQTVVIGQSLCTPRAQQRALLGRPARRNVTVVLAAKKAAPAHMPPAEVPSYFKASPVAEATSTTAEAAPVSSPAQQAATQAATQPHYYPPPPPRPAGFWSSMPPLVLIGVGVLAGGILGKVLEFVKGGPQKMQEVMMQQMMKQVMKQMGAPGGTAGANPFGAAGANPFAGFPPMSPPAGGVAANPFGANFPSGFPGSTGAGTAQAPIDTTATPAPAAPAAAAATPPAAEASTSASTSASSSSKPKRKAFTDVVAEPAPPPPTTPVIPPSSSSTAPPQFADFAPPPPGSIPGFGASAAAGGIGAASGSTTQGASNVAGTMLDMLKNPEMQKMLYPYLPEAMRNPETFEWMLSNPEYRSQLEGMLQQQAAAAGNPAVTEMMKGMDMSPEKMQAQFDQLGMSPDQFISKVMADPSLATSMTKPNVMAAIAECTQNPMNIFKYQNDAEVMNVFTKMQALFPQAAGAGGFPTPPR